MINNFNDIKKIAELNPIIHSPARLAVTLMLCQSHTLDFLQLMKHTELTWGNLSTHLTKLEKAGYLIITKSFKGKRPQTLVTLTDTGRQAYFDWANDIVKALPQSLHSTISKIAEKTGMTEQSILDLTEYKLPQVPQKEVFFLPKYHRWTMEQPPIDELNILH